MINEFRDLQGIEYKFHGETAWLFNYSPFYVPSLVRTVMVNVLIPLTLFLLKIINDNK